MGGFSGDAVRAMRQTQADEKDLKQRAAAGHLACLRISVAWNGTAAEQADKRLEIAGDCAAQ